MEIDLHGMNVAMAAEYFIKSYNSALKRGENLRVIHGYGRDGHSSKIKKYITKLAMYEFGICDIVTGEKIDGNPGYTIIRPKKQMPETNIILEGEIFEFCEAPKTVEKIIGNFRKYGEPMVLEALKKMEKTGVLKSGYKGRYKVYSAMEE